MRSSKKLLLRFLNNKDQLDAKRKLMISRLTQHESNLKEITSKQRTLGQELAKKVGSIRYKILLKHVSSKLQRERLLSFKTKYKKLEVLISKVHKREKVSDSYKTPIINLSNIELALEESKQLNLGLEYSVVNKNRNIKNFLAANFGSVVDRITDNLQSDQREKLHEFLHTYVDIFTKSVYKTTDSTYKHLKRIVNNKNLVVLSGDKESCVALIDKTDYQDKLQNLIDDGISKVAEDNTLRDLKLFKSFLSRNFRKYEHYQEMLPNSNQQGQLCGTAKAHKFTNIDGTIIDNLKFRQIIAQTGTYTYNPAQVIAKYLRPLCSGNNYIIRNT